MTRWALVARSHEADRQKLAQLGHCAQRSDARIEVRAGTEFDELLRILHPVRDHHEARNPEIAGDVEHPEAASGFGKLGFQVANVGIVELAEVHFRPLQSIVPPDRIRIPLHQFEKSLDDGFFQRVAGGAAIGVRVDLVGAGAAVEKIQQAGRKIFESLVAQRPDRRPFELGRSIERSRRRRRSVFVDRLRQTLPGLRVAVVQDVVRKNGVARREIAESPREPDLVALKYPGIALDRLHQRAGFTLFGRAALAEAAAAQPGLEFVDRLGAGGEIVRGKEVRVHRQVGVDPLEARNNASERAHVLAITCNRAARRNGPISAAGHEQLAAGAELDRDRLAAGIAQLLAAADRTLRAGGHVMLHDGRAQADRG